MLNKLVTCIYNGLNHTKLCGRLNRDRPYSYSLKTIVNSGTDITCYTSPEEINKFKTEFTELNINFIPKSLYELYFHEEVNNIRDLYSDLYRTSPDWRDRCMEIMWGKFIFMKETIKLNPNIENIFWIDAGISHSGIIHSRFNSNFEHNLNFIHDLNKETYPLTFKNDLIFNKNFMDNLINYTGDNILNIVSINPQHPIAHTSIHKNFKGSVIGGIFGGHVSLIDSYCDRIIELFEFFLKEKKLYKEEQLMTYILSEETFPIKIFSFNTWYHADWGDNRFNSSQISFCDFFDEIKK
jgi:hypothetical protein